MPRVITSTFLGGYQNEKLDCRTLFGFLLPAMSLVYTIPEIPENSNSSIPEAV